MPLRALLLDGDGVIWISSTPIAGAVESLNAIRAMGVRLVLVTNNSSKTRAAYVRFFDQIGIAGFTADDVFTSGYAAALYLKRQNLTSLLVSGFEGLCEELRMQGHAVHTAADGPAPPSVQAVVCGKGDRFSWADICAGVGAVRLRGARLIGVNPDPNFPCRAASSCRAAARSPARSGSRAASRRR
jgi:HAD superfamily hydrolase (TIGR01450 family)